MDEEVLIHKVPQGEFETLIWERHMNKELCKELAQVKQEKGALEAEVMEIKNEMEELIKEMRKSNVGALVVKNRQLKEQLAAKDKKLSEAKRNNESIFRGYIELQQEKRRGLFQGNKENSSSEAHSSASPLES
jgi:regulator of replication initiation timing